MALAAGLADIGYVAWRSFGRGDDIRAEWVAYMPALEAKQYAIPWNLIEAADGGDPDYPPRYVEDDGEDVPLIVKIAHHCGISEFAISHYPGDTPRNPIVQMPDRLFIGRLDARMAECVRRSLPRGYVLARLDRARSPWRVGWGKGELPLAAKQ